MIVGVVYNRFAYLSHSVIDGVNTLTKIAETPKSFAIDDAASFENLTKAIANRESIFIRSDGSWYKNRWIVALFRKIVGKDESLLTARQLAKYLSKPIFVKGENFQGCTQRTNLTPQKIDRLVKTVRTVLQPQVVQEEEYRDTAKEDLKTLRESNALSEAELVEFSRKSFDKGNFRVHTALAELERAQLSFLYLGIKQESIEGTQEEPNDPKWMEEKLEEWQERTFPTINFLEGDYREGTLSKITRSCKYGKFIEAVRHNPLLRDFFFHAILRNAPKDSTEAVDIFIQMPQIQTELHRCYLDTRIQHIRNNGLKINQYVDAKTGKIAKDVTLLINGMQQSITDPSRIVRVSEKVEMTVRKLFDTFKKGLDRGFIEYEYLQETGISEFDGRCRGIDLTKKDWWKDLPVVERLTRSEVSEKYDADFSQGKALLVLRSSRKYPDLHAQDTHAWLDVVVPLENGSFNVISVGKFSDTFPVGDMESLFHVFKAQPAELTVVDPNKFYGWRERIHYPFPPLDEARFDVLMEKIRNDFIRCREKKEYFEAQGDNCAKWVEGTIKAAFPEFKLNPFDTHFSEVSVPHLTFIGQLGNWFRVFACTVLGAWRGVDFLNEDGSKRTVRLIRHPDWIRGNLRIPAKIFEKNRAEEIKKAIKEIKPVIVPETTSNEKIL